MILLVSIYISYKSSKKGLLCTHTAVTVMLLLAIEINQYNQIKSANQINQIGQSNQNQQQPFLSAPAPSLSPLPLPASILPPIVVVRRTRPVATNLAQASFVVPVLIY